MQQHDRLAEFAGAARDLQEKLRLAQMLGDRGDDLGAGILDDVGEEILDRRRRLVAGRDDIGRIDAVLQQRPAQR
jgi:hypothetical protein